MWIITARFLPTTARKLRGVSEPEFIVNPAFLFTVILLVLLFIVMLPPGSLQQ